LTTVVLDRRPPGRGSTAASTALLQFEIDTPLIHLAEQIGMRDARRAWLRSYAAVGDLEHRVRALGIDCGFRPRTALYLAGNVLGPSELAEEARQRHAIGLPSQYLSAGELRSYAGIERDGAVLSQGAADVNPVQLSAGLLRRAVQRGCRVYSPARAVEVVPQEGCVEILTDAGAEIRTRTLVFATGYELAHGVPSKGHKISSTWAFATPPQPLNLWPQCDLVWEAADPYLYVRTTTDGRVIAGGEDEAFENEDLRDALLPQKMRALQAKLKGMFPRVDAQADFAWTGTFGESDTGLPSIGAVPGMANCYAVLGYGGNGITFSVIAGQMIQRQICGLADADSDVFAFR
jgi:glycine/D-amino acid oxidase-like deaminating enzyme